MGSPWDPVEITHTLPGGRVADALDVDERVVGDVRAGPSPGPGPRSCAIDRPSVATMRPLAMAASAICWMRWMWLAKQAVMIRLSAVLGEQVAQHLAHRALAGGVARLLGVGGVGQQQADAGLVGQGADAGQVGAAGRRPA